MNKNDAENEEVLEPNAKNIILSIISQLSKGSDIQRISLPTFVLEPRSFLEKITDFMAHPRLLLNTINEEESLKRFVGVVQYYLSGWHVRPTKGVKKPYNPVLGEFFRCWWNYDNGTKGYYISEQVSHHPPRSCYTFVSPDNGFLIQGTMFPKSRFYGTSAGTILEGKVTLKLLRYNESYIITYPNIYVHGLLFGELVYDLGDQATINCQNTGFSCKLIFKSKGFFGGSYNSVSGKVRNGENETLCEINGQWSEELSIKFKDGDSKQLFDANSETVHPKNCLNFEKQEEFESRKLWKELTVCINSNNMEDAAQAKQVVEEAQRKRRNTSEQKLRFYKRKETSDDENLDYEWGFGDFDERTTNKDIEEYIFGSQLLEEND